MAYDWKGLERRNHTASDRLMRGLGIIWTTMGVLGLILVLLTGQTRRLDSAIFWFVLGVIYLVISARARKKRRSQAQEDQDKP